MESVKDLIEAAKKILILGSRPDGDLIGSTVALMKVLESRGKSVTSMVNGDVPKNLKFLEEVEKIKEKIDLERDFIIILDTSKNAAKKVSTNPEEGKLNIIITPAPGSKFDSSMVSFGAGIADCDLIIVVDTPDSTLLGENFSDIKTLLQRTTVVNIDHHISNKKFGTKNLIDLDSSSTCEILYNMFMEYGYEINPQVATALLTGILSDTKTFQNTNTTPRSVAIGAELMNLGADRKKIVMSVYKNKSYNILRFWGKILENIKTDADLSAMWSMVSAQDFKEYGVEDTDNIIDELMTGVQDYNTIFLLSEKMSNFITGSIRTNERSDADAIAATFGGGGHKRSAGFRIMGKSLQEAEKMMLDAVAKANLAPPVDPKANPNTDIVPSEAANVANPAGSDLKFEMPFSNEVQVSPVTPVVNETPLAAPIMDLPSAETPPSSPPEVEVAPAVNVESAPGVQTTNDAFNAIKVPATEDENQVFSTSITDQGAVSTPVDESMLPPLISDQTTNFEQQSQYTPPTTVPEIEVAPMVNVESAPEAQTIAALPPVLQQNNSSPEKPPAAQDIDIDQLLADLDMGNANQAANKKEDVAKAKGGAQATTANPFDDMDDIFK